MATTKSSRPLSQTFPTVLNCLWKPSKPIHPRRPLQPALPDYKDSPAGLQKLGHGLSVPDDIHLELSFPEFNIARRHGCILAALMPMPVTPVNEHHRAMARKDEIRLPGQILCVKAVTQSMMVQEASDQHFRAGILAADACHHARSGIRRYDVCHVRHYSSTSQSQSIACSFHAA